MSVLAWIESTNISIWVRESGSVWSYPMIITVHAWGMTMLVGVSALIDLRLLGFAPGIPLPPLKKLFSVIKVGFWLSLLSGTALTMADAASMLISPIFYIKMACIAVALTTVVLIERRVARVNMATDLIPATGKALAIISLVFWTASITAGRLTAYLGPAAALTGITH